MVASVVDGEWRWQPYQNFLNSVFIDLRSDLRTAQVYCDPIFLVSQEVSLNFHHFCG